MHATDVVAELNYIPGDLVRVPAARHLDIAPEDLSKHMLRSVGDKIEEGEPLLVPCCSERRNNQCANQWLCRSCVNSQVWYVRQPMPLGDDQPVVIDLVKEHLQAGIGGCLTCKSGPYCGSGQVLCNEPRVIPKSMSVTYFGRVQSYRDGIITIVPVRSRNTAGYLTGRVEAGY